MSFLSASARESTARDSHSHGHSHRHWPTTNQCGHCPDGRPTYRRPSSRSGVPSLGCIICMQTAFNYVLHINGLGLNSTCMHADDAVYAHGRCRPSPHLCWPWAVQSDFLCPHATPFSRVPWPMTKYSFTCTAACCTAVYCHVQTNCRPGTA